VLPGDDATGGLEHSLVVLGLLLPANEQSSEAIDPGMQAFDHPAARLRVGMVGRCLALFTAASDMGRQVVVVGDLPESVIVVALVRAQGRLAGERLLKQLVAG
jgi:hypothetical protein